MMIETFSRTQIRLGGVALALAAAASLGACSSRGDDTLARADSAAAGAANQVGAAIDTAASAGAVATDTISNRVGSALDNDWTDADIVAYLLAADSSEIAAGRLASTKATDPSVKEFAKKVVSDHGTMLDETLALAQKEGIAYATASEDDIDDLRSDGREDLRELTNKQAGAAWDRAYVEEQVDAHEDVIDDVTDFTQVAKNPQLATMLQQALPKLQGHLDAAKALRRK